MSSDPSTVAGPPMQIFLHSDDLGATPGISLAILDAWSRGQLDGFSVLANGTALEEVKGGLAHDPARAARIVAHLNLSEGRPCADPKDVPLLLDADGRLKWGFGALAWATCLPFARMRRALLQQIAIEWRAQLAVLEGMVHPRRLTGVDGHIHVHMLPPLFDIARDLAQERGIGWIRIAREPFPWFSHAGTLLKAGAALNVVKALVLRAFSARDLSSARRAGLKSADRIVGVLYSGCMTADGALAILEAARREGATSTEVIFHVGRAGPLEYAAWAGAGPSAAFACAAQRDEEKRQLSLLHERLRSTGLRPDSSRHGSAA